MSIEIDDESYAGLTPEQVRKEVVSIVKGLGPTVDKMCDRVMETIPVLLDNLVTSLADRKVKEVKKGSRAALRHNRRMTERFKRHVKNVWAGALDALQLQIGVTAEINQRYVAQSNERREKRGLRVRQVLMSLHARACQIAQEALLLLSYGYADGAHARWRSLHEVATVACVVAAHGERTAYRYLMHETAEAEKSAREQLEWVAAVGRREW